MSAYTLHLIVLTGISVFCMGAAGLVRGRTSLVNALLAIELMFLSLSILLIACWLHWRTSHIPTFIMFILGLSAAEVAVGLALLYSCFKSQASNGFSALRNLKE